MSNIEHLLENNRKWAKSKSKNKPNYFKNLARPQKPKYLWISCSDSRIPGTEIVGLVPGEVFVHRNIGNLVNSQDLNCMSVLQFAIATLNISNILIVGHYQCGAIKAAFTNKKMGLIDNWLLPIIDLKKNNSNILNSYKNFNSKLEKLSELNVITQVNNLAKNSLIQSWKNKQDKKIKIYGLIYNLSNGLLKDLNCTMEL